jgi:ribosomal protein S18 acetylase RimI-like enzyme
MPLIKNSTKIRPATKTDVDALVALDPLSRTDEKRIPFIQHAVHTGTCYVVEYDSLIVGYGVFGYTLFGYGFIEMLYCHPEFRRKGFGTKLMSYFESLCATEKIFTSTNQSNIPMQLLLANIGFQVSGVINGFDEGDPELFYVKRLIH